MIDFGWDATTPVPEAVGEALGAVAYCWEPKPTGVFDSQAAEVILDQLLDFLRSKSIGLD